MKKYITILGMLLLVAGANAQVADEARKLMYYERYGSAEDILENALKNGNADAKVYYLLLNTYIKEDKNTQAKALVEDKLAQNSSVQDNEFTKITKASYLLQNDKRDQAMALFNEVLTKRNRKEADIVMAVAKANLMAKDGDLNFAIGILNEAIEKNKKNADLYLTLGQVYAKLNDGGQAITALNQAIELDPGNAKALYLSGRIYLTQKNTQVYLPLFTRAYNADPKFAPAIYELYSYYYFRDVKEAKKYLDQYLAVTDYSIQQDYMKTDMLFVTEEYQKAIASATQILGKEKEKAQPRMYKLIAYSYKALKQNDKALEYMNTYFAKEKPGNIVPKDYEFIAEVSAADEGKEKEAIAYYEKAAYIDTVLENKLNYIQKGAALSEKIKDYADQAKLLKQVLDLKEDPSNLDLYNYGVALFSNEQYKESDEIFAKYTEKYPDQIYGYYWRAKCNALIDTSMTSGLAIPHYEKVIEIGITDPGKNKNLLTRSYGYLGSYEANITKDFEKSLGYFEKYLELDPGNADVQKYANVLKKWIEDNKGKESGQSQSTSKDSSGGDANSN